VSLRLCLVRHTSTEWSGAARLLGWTDLPLDDAGREAARELRGTLGGRTFDAVWSSDLRRTIETAELAGFRPVPDARLREIDFGELEGTSFFDLDPEVQRAMIAFEGGAPGGESVEQLRARVEAWRSELAGGEHLVFTHGGVIRLLARGLGDDRMVMPGQIVEIEL
jgi:probable phosphoglycerate mutase